MKLISITFFVLYVSVGIADQYLHYPKGSNNRLNEQSANRNNGNRLFDSQNNNRGGYNVGEFGATQGFDQNDGYATDSLNFDYSNDNWRGNNNANGRRQFEEPMLEGSVMKVTWTSQHGCGNPKNNCNMIYDWTCDSHPQDDDVLAANYNPLAQNQGWQSDAWKENAAYEDMTGLRVQLKNGLNTNTPDDPNNIRNVPGTKTNNDAGNEARSESEEWYAFAKARTRNQYLFTADQNLQGNDQTKTRQNPGGTRRGLEVPEERDYASWWYPTIWRTEFITSNNVDECISQMASKSATGGETKRACVPKKAAINSGENTAAGMTNNELAALVKIQDGTECVAAGGFWLQQQYDYPMPECLQAQWSQVNNLGNVLGTPRGGEPQNVNWTIPTVQAMADTGCYVYHSDEGVDYIRAQIRMRYNMSTMDYAPYTTTAACNQDKNNGVQSPVEQNPTIDIGAYMQGLRLALNTAQTGRTFQDRTHVMRIIKRPINGLPTTNAQSSAENVAGSAAVDAGFADNALGSNTAALVDGATNNNAANTGTVAIQPTVYNVNVQGKRGNIVQTFPAVEYDFWPRHIEIPAGACLAFQWTGSNTHNNGNPAGDGQAGDAGEGRGGSDRSNLIQLLNKNSSYPVPLDTEIIEDFFENSKCYQTYTGNAVSSGLTAASKQASGATDEERTTNNMMAKHAQAYLLSAGFYNGMSKVGTFGGNNAANELDGLLNNTPASMRGLTCCPQVTGTYQFMSSRNNNFSNRDQKLTVVVL